MHKNSSPFKTCEDKNEGLRLDDVARTQINDIGATVKDGPVDFLVFRSLVAHRIFSRDCVYTAAAMERWRRS